ncbi:hypothetical protein BV25DRAFT_1832242 [Artomyces pyxidatus]|uniref:Uncharacterized protein n=1 Tax=Artomyces pyxidatus TaxID=48021 RepID=A0ACB8SJP7_9AGAM|nr:hypothetical protein BV25DRAFT_1832242 [Artomyces pyxidatus]
MSTPEFPADCLPLIVAQYSTTGHFRRTEHWAFAVLESRMHATLFELRGTMDTFCFECEPLSAFERAPGLRGGAHVGWVPRARLQDGWLRAQLARSRGVKHDGGAYCKAEGVVFEKVREEWLKRELKADYGRSETGEDTVEERLFPKL